MKPSITICIAACNEQLKIRKALESARACSWCSELLVFDSGSTDKTVEICQEYADRVEFHEWVDYSTSKRKMSEAASHDWVFILDADEEISPELAKEIEGLDDSIFRDHPVITMPRHNYLLGRWAKSWYPDRQNRLFDRHRTDWPYRSVHDFRVPKEGTEKHLRHPLLHNRHVDEWSDYFEGRRVENRANAIAQEMFDRGKRVGYFDLMVRPWISFVKYFFLKKGFTQGAFGLMQAQHRVLATQLKYAKLWYLQQVEKDKCLAPKGSQTKRVLPAAPSTDLKVQSNAPVTHQKKNVLVLCSDTFRHDALGAMHGHEVHTPHLDRLVEQSARFENFWCCSIPR